MPGRKLYFENGICIEIEEVVGAGGTALTYYGREYRDDHAGIYTSAESTAGDAGSSSGRIF